MKGRALLSFDLAECRIGQGEIEEACQTAHGALDMASEAMVRPIVARAEELHRSLTAWQGARPVAELTDRIHAAAQATER